MFYIWVCIWSCLVLCICLLFGFIFYVWEKICGLCLSEPGLLHLTWCSSITSIYLQTTCHYSLWLSKLHCVYIPNFLILFISCRTSGWFHNSFAILNSALLNIGVQVSRSYPDLHSLGRCSGVVSLDHMAVLSLILWGISIQLSIMVVLICISTISV
jgi:hypothetical protein